MGKLIFALCAAVGMHLIALPAAAQAKATQKIAYNPDKMTNKYYALACESPSNMDKAIKLNNSNRFDLLPRIGCTVIPEETEVLQVDQIGTTYKQVLWEVEGQSRFIWVRHQSFRDKRERAIWEECEDPHDFACRDKVSKRFKIVW